MFILRMFMVALVALISFSGDGAAKDYKVVTIATEGAYAPWNFKDASGKLIGFEVELANHLCELMGVECQVVTQAWDGMIPALRVGKYDAIMAGMSITSKREKVISFSRAYAAAPARFVVLKSSPLANLETIVQKVSLPELTQAETDALSMIKTKFQDRAIGVQIATTHEKFLRGQLGEHIRIRTYDTQENLDLDLRASRVDAALANMSYWKPLLDSEKGEGLMAVGPAFTGGPFGRGVGVGLRKEDQQLADMFSKAIDEAITSGILSQMALKWFGFDASVK